MRMHNPPHPGKVLREFLGGIEVTTAARHLQVSRAALSRILNGKAGISADMSLRLYRRITIFGRQPRRNAPGLAS